MCIDLTRYPIRLHNIILLSEGTVVVYSWQNPFTKIYIIKNSHVIHSAMDLWPEAKVPLGS